MVRILKIITENIGTAEYVGDVDEKEGSKKVRRAKKKRTKGDEKERVWEEVGRGRTEKKRRKKGYMMSREE